MLAEIEWVSLTVGHLRACDLRPPLFTTPAEAIDGRASLPVHIESLPFVSVVLAHRLRAVGPFLTADLVREAPHTSSLLSLTSRRTSSWHIIWEYSLLKHARLPVREECMVSPRVMYLVPSS